MSLTDQQKAAREKALGSSDAPIVAGVSPYCSPLELYYKLHGELPRYSDEETEAQEWGSRLEAVIAHAFADKTQSRIRRMPGRTHKQHPCMVAHPDYEIIGGPEGPGLLEIKARDRVDLQRWEHEGVPDDIALQVHHQLAVTQREWAKVAVLFSGKQFRIYEVRSDKELEEYLIEIESRFMLRVEKGEPPDETWTPETVGLLKKLYPRDSGKVIELLPDSLLSMKTYLEGKRLIEEGEVIKAIGEGWLKQEMQDASVAKIPGFGEITWKKTKDGTTFHEEQFKKDHPDLYAQYQIPRLGYRRFVVRPTKESLHARISTGTSGDTVPSLPES